GKIDADHHRRRPHGPYGQREVAGAGGQVEHGSRRRAHHGPGGQPAPRVVTAARHDRVHDVVSPGDAGEHRADPRRIRVDDARYHHNPPTTAASTITAM